MLLLLNFAIILGVFRLFGQVGMFVWIAIATISANIQVTKTIELLGVTATLGNIVYAGTFLATDILSERYGKDAARRGVMVGFLAIISVTLLMNAALWFDPAPSDTMHEHLSAVFGLLPRISAGSLLAYWLSQSHDIWAFHFWKQRVPKHLWLRNNLSTLLSQLLDSTVFVLVAFWGVYEGSVLFEIAVTTYVIKAIVAVLDTPFIYIARRMRVSEMIARP